MSQPPARRNRGLGVGLGLLVLTGMIFALGATAMPVVVDIPLAALVVATAAALASLAGVLREAGLATGGGRRRLGVGVAALIAATTLAAASAHQRFLSHRSEEVRFASGGVELAGTVLLPRSGAPHPAIVFVHGSGPETRREYLFFARLFARNGFVALAYDKRGTGASAGSLYEADYGDYAEDAMAGVRQLAHLGAVDARCIGLIGFSEGEWVAPLAASRSSDVAFLAVVAPSGVSLARQVNEEIALRLRARGYSATDVDRALSLNERVFEYQRTGKAPEGLADELAQVADAPWFADAEDIPDRLYPPDAYRWWRSVMDFAPASVWEQVRIPTLLLKGGRDRNSTPELARREIEAALTRGGNPSFDFVVHPEGDHALLRWPRGERVPPPLFAHGYPETMVRWAREQECARR